MKTGLWGGNVENVKESSEEIEESGAKWVGKGRIKPKGNSYWPLAVVSSA